MAIEKQTETAPVVDDASPVPAQVPSKGQDDQASEGTEQRAEPSTARASAASSPAEPARPPSIPDAAPVPQRTPTEPTLPMPVRVRNSTDESGPEPERRAS